MDNAPTLHSSPDPTPPTVPTMYTDLVTALVRHVVTGLGAVLISRGVLTADQSVALMPLASGLVTFAIGVGWSWWQKRHAKQVLNVALVKAGTTEARVVAIVAKGIAVPSVLTPPTVVPTP